MRYSLVLAAAMALPGHALGQTTADQSPRSAPGVADNPDIVVTARRREESLQDVPLAISVFSADKIAQVGISNLEGIAQRTPGLSFNTNLGTLYPGREGTSIRMRGIGDAEGAEITKLQPTSVFIDGAFVLNGAQSIGLDDLERVEVIKGPQAAVFGRNSFAGAINYVTRSPDLNDFKGQINAKAATYDQYEVSATIEGPIVRDTLSALLSVRGYNKGSMYRASDGGRLGEESSRSVSGVLYYKPSDRFSAKLRLFYQRDDDGPAASGFIPGRLADTCTGTSRPGLNDAGAPVTLFPTRFICGSVPQLSDLNFRVIDSNTSLRPQTFAGANQDFLIDNLLNAKRIAGVPKLDRFGLKRNMFRASLNVSYEFDGGTSLTAIGSYNDNKAAVLRDLDLTSVESWYQYNARAGKDKGIDIQLASPSGGRLTWLIGGNYYDQNFLTSASGGTFVAACLAGFCGSGPLLLPTPDDGGDKAKVFSGYGSVSLRIFDHLTLGGEGRYQIDQRSDGVSGVKQTFKRFLPRVTLSYEPTRSLTIYGNWSQGFLPGLVNGNVLNCSPRSYTAPFTDPNTGKPSTSSECDQLRQQLGSSFKAFTKPQTLNAFEFGFKSSLFQNTLQLGASAYFYKWSNQPSTNFATVYRDDNGDGIPNATINTAQIFSSGSSRSRGIEADMTYRPLRGWQIEGNVSYNDNEYTDYLGLVTFARANGGSRNFKGNRSPRFPKWSGTLASTYRYDVKPGLAFFGRAEVTYQGRVFTGSENLASIDPYALVNLRLGVDKDNIRVELFVDNALAQDNYRSGLSYFDVADIKGSFDFNNLGVTVIPQDKRTIGLRTSFKF